MRRRKMKRGRRSRRKRGEKGVRRGGGEEVCVEDVCGCCCVFYGCGRFVLFLNDDGKRMHVLCIRSRYTLGCSSIHNEGRSAEALISFCVIGMGPARASRDITDSKKKMDEK
jgi:hypothetical protein